MKGLREGRASNRYHKLQLQYKDISKSYSKIVKENKNLEQQVKMTQRKLNTQKSRAARLSLANSTKAKIKNLKASLKKARALLKIQHSENLQNKLNRLKEQFKAECCKVQELQQHVQYLDEERLELLAKLNELEVSNKVITELDGGTYSNEVRALYYQLLAYNVPSSKIEKIIIAVLNTFCPSINTSELSLPKLSLQ